MKILKAPVGFLVFLVVGSCVSYNVRVQNYDSLTDPFTTYTQTIYVDMLYTNSVTVSVSKTVSTGPEYFSIEVVYGGSGWLFLPGDITIKADNKAPFTIIDSNPHRMVMSGGVRETVRATISKERLFKIAEATTLRMDFFAEPITISNTGLDSLKKFVDEYAR